MRGILLAIFLTAGVLNAGITVSGGSSTSSSSRASTSSSHVGARCSNQKTGTVFRTNNRTLAQAHPQTAAAWQYKGASPKIYQKNSDKDKSDSKDGKKANPKKSFEPSWPLGKSKR